MNITQRRIVEAVARGYRIEGQNLIGPRGPIQIKLYGNQRYPTFSTNWGGKVLGVPVHLFAAYIYYGEAAFEKGIQVRHLNGNTLDIQKSNILLGTSSENQMDKCPEARRNAAIKARKSQPSTPGNAKLNPQQISEIRSAYASLDGRKAPNGFTKLLTEKYGVSRTVINKVVRGIHYAC